MFVFCQNGEAVHVLHGDDRLVEVAVLPGVFGALLRFDSVFIAVFAAEALRGGDEVSADTLRGEVGVVGRLRVFCPRAAVCSHGDAGHGFDTAGEHQLVPAGRGFLGGRVDGFQARGAEPVELDTCHGVGQAGRDRCRAGDDSALFVDGGDHAEHDVVDFLGVSLGVALENGVDEAGHEVNGLGSVQCAAAVLTARGAHRVIDVRV